MCKIVAWAHPGGFCAPAARSDLNVVTMTQLLASNVIGPGAPDTVLVPIIQSLTQMADPSGNLMLLLERGRIIILQRDCVPIYEVRATWALY